jgi:DNA (cytosine-5)-methyltransferase 1
MKKINLLTLFSGIGSPEQGASRVYDEVNLVAACEWDKYARESFKANYHIEDEHFHKDINDMDGTQYKGKVDILVGGSPCQDFSLAGLRAGVDGNKGILIYEYIRIIKEVEPPIFIYENVKGMLSDKKGKTIKDFVEAFRDMGYYCHYEVLNTKDYGIPQNRERIFLVGFKDVEHYYNFSFAPKIKLEKRLKDILENDVDEKYYLSNKMIKCLDKRVEISKGYEFKPQIGDKVANCLTTRYGNYSTDTYLKVIGELDNNYRIRKLTPVECFRLQDFPDSFKFVVSNTQLYKQAGNSISVNMMEMIFNQIELSRNASTNKGE